MLLLELPFRVGVLSLDLQAHDAHHLKRILTHHLEVLHFFQDDRCNQTFRRAEMMRAAVIRWAWRGGRSEGCEHS